jgi:hypothetical protein
MPSTNYALIRNAILNKQVVTASVHGHQRVMCPHTLGLAKDGSEQGLFYQFAGESKSRPIQPSGSPANWRCISIDDLQDVSVAAGDWHTCDVHGPVQTCVAKIDVEYQP